MAGRDTTNTPTGDDEESSNSKSSSSSIPNPPPANSNSSPKPRVQVATTFNTPTSPTSTKKATQTADLIQIEEGSPNPHIRRFHRQTPDRIFKSIGAFLRRHMPLTQSMKHYTWNCFFEDVVAGLIVSMSLLPQAIAYAGLARVSVIQGLISAVYVPIFYLLFGGSISLAVGPETAVAIITGSTINTLTENPMFSNLSPDQIASVLALLVGIVAIGLAILKGGFIDQVLSGYLLTGFILGLANLIIIDQLPALLGLDLNLNSIDAAINKFIDVCKNFGASHWPTVLISITNISFLLCAKYLKKTYFKNNHVVAKIPQILVLVTIMIAVSYGIDARSHGISTLGVFSNIIARPAAPPLTLDLLVNLIEQALIILLVGFLESQTITRNFGLKHGRVPSGENELFAFGFANFLGSFLGVMPTFSSLPRSRVLAATRPHSTIANAVAAVLVLVYAKVSVNLLQYLPRATLSSSVTVAALSLIELKELKFVIDQQAWSEIAMLVTTFVITLTTTIPTGFLLCMSLSAVLILRKTTSSIMSPMGRINIESSKSMKNVAALVMKQIERKKEAQQCHNANSTANGRSAGSGSSSSGYTAVAGGSGSMDTVSSSLLLRQLPSHQVPLKSHGGSDHHHGCHVTSVRTVPDVSRFVSLLEHPDAELLEGVLLLRVDVSLVFYNCGRLKSAIEKLMRVQAKVLRQRLLMHRPEEEAEEIRMHLQQHQQQSEYLTSGQSRFGGSRGYTASPSPTSMLSPVSPSSPLRSRSPYRQRLPWSMADGNEGELGESIEGSGLTSMAWLEHQMHDWHIHVDMSALRRLRGGGGGGARRRHHTAHVVQGQSMHHHQQQQHHATPPPSPLGRYGRSGECPSPSRGRSRSSTPTCSYNDVSGTTLNMTQTSLNQQTCLSDDHITNGNVNDNTRDNNNTSNNNNSNNNNNNNHNNSNSSSSSTSNININTKFQNGKYPPPPTHRSSSRARSPERMTMTTESEADVSVPPEHVERISEDIHTVVWDFRNCLELDSAACFVISRILLAFQSMHISYYLCGLHSSHVLMFKKAKMEHLIEGKMYESMTAAVIQIENVLGTNDNEGGGDHNNSDESGSGGVRWHRC